MSCTSCQNVTIEGFESSPVESQNKGCAATGCSANQNANCLYNAQGEFICDKNIPGVPNEYMVLRPHYEKNIAQYAGSTK